eukprot:scaffold54209_cov29-Prasinocladus_malaysianus.AAC.1
MDATVYRPAAGVCCGLTYMGLRVCCTRTRSGQPCSCSWDVVATRTLNAGGLWTLRRSDATSPVALVTTLGLLRPVPPPVNLLALE